MMKVAENPMKSAIVPYGMTLNKVFKCFKVPLKDENIDTNYQSFDKRNQINMKIFQPLSYKETC